MENAIPLPEEISSQTASPNQTFIPPPKKNINKVLIIISIFILISLITGGYYLWMKKKTLLNNSSQIINNASITPTSTIINEPTAIELSSTVIPSSTTALINPQNPDSFYISIGGDVKRERTSYTLTERMVPVPTGQEIKNEIFGEDCTKSIYRFETVNVDNNKNTYYACLSYNSDNNTQHFVRDNEFPTGTTANIYDIFIPIKVTTKEINFYVNQTLIKSISKKAKGPVITTFTKKAIDNERSQELSWNIDTDDEEKTWVHMAFLDKDGIEEGFPSGEQTYKAFKNQITPKAISVDRKESVDVELRATDGFHMSVWRENNFLEVDKHLPRSF